MHVAPLQVPELRDGCLLRRVVEVRAQGRGLLLPPKLGFVESDLVQQVLILFLPIGLGDVHPRSLTLRAGLSSLCTVFGVYARTIGSYGHGCSVCSPVTMQQCFCRSCTCYEDVRAQARLSVLTEPRTPSQLCLVCTSLTCPRLASAVCCAIGSDGAPLPSGELYMPRCKTFLADDSIATLTP